jgi:hypothetical protein
VGAVADGASPGRSDEALEPLLASVEFHTRQVLPVEVHEVEDEVDEPAVAAGRQGVLKGLEAGRPVRQQYRDLAIEERLTRGEPGGRRRDLRESRSPVVSIAAPERGATLVDPAEDAVAIELHLVEPGVAAGRGGHERG